MLKKDITFNDLDGNKVTKTFYFNISKRELVDMELETPGGLSEKLRFIMSMEDAPSVLKIFKMIVELSVGERMEDNITFKKTPEITEAFKQTDAYDELLFSFIQDPRAATDFLIAIMPAEFRDKVNVEDILKQAQEQAEARVIPNSDRQQVARGPKTLSEYTEQELAEMSTEELDSRIKNAGGNIPKAALLEAYKRKF